MPVSEKGKTSRARALRRSQTTTEAKLWYRLRNRQLGGHKFLRQKPIGRYFADFCCREAKLIIELDSDQHAQSKSDAIRDKALNARGYRILRFWNNEVTTNIDGVLETIYSALGPHNRND